MDFKSFWGLARPIGARLLFQGKNLATGLQFCWLRKCHTEVIDSKHVRENRSSSTVKYCMIFILDGIVAIRGRLKAVNKPIWYDCGFSTLLLNLPVEL